jgi:hypothetical protein
MKPIYLRHRPNALAPWTLPPDLSAVFPGLPVGALPIDEIILATEPPIVTTCGCSDTAAADDHYVLHGRLMQIPQQYSLAVIDFLLQYKNAPLHESKQERYLNNIFYPTDLANLRARESLGMTDITFRLLLPMSGV